MVDGNGVVLYERNVPSHRDVYMNGIAHVTNYNDLVVFRGGSEYTLICGDPKSIGSYSNYNRARINY